MIRYDPMAGPDPAEWVAVDDWKRLDAIVDCHRRERINLPNETVHATIHCVVENQVALGSEIPVAETCNGPCLLPAKPRALTLRYKVKYPSPVTSIHELWGLTSMFAAMFVGSALLLRKAARDLETV